MFAKMSSADRVQMNGFDCWFVCARKDIMACSSSSFDLRLPLFKRFRFNNENHGTTKFSHELLIGVKWKCMFGWANMNYQYLIYNSEVSTKKFHCVEERIIYGNYNCFIV